MEIFKAISNKIKTVQLNKKIKSYIDAMEEQKRTTTMCLANFLFLDKKRNHTGVDEIGSKEFNECQLEALSIVNETMAKIDSQIVGQVNENLSEEEMIALGEEIESNFLNSNISFVYQSEFDDIQEQRRVHANDKNKYQIYIKLLQAENVLNKLKEFQESSQVASALYAKYYALKIYYRLQLKKIKSGKHESVAVQKEN